MSKMCVFTDESSGTKFAIPGGIIILMEDKGDGTNIYCRDSNNRYVIIERFSEAVTIVNESLK